MKIGITSNFPEVAKQLARLEREVADFATVRAVNRTMEQAKTSMSREIRSQFNLPAKKVNESLRLRRASFKRGTFSLEATLESPTVRGRSLNLIHFVEKSVSLAQARRRMKAGEGGTHTLRNGGQVRKAFELRVKIKRGGQPKIVKGAFIGNKGRTVFIREGKERLPIVPVQTIDVAQMFNTKRINEKVVAVIRERFPRIWAREVRYYTDRFNSRRGR